jgi:PAS domain S-box-containing protein
MMPAVMARARRPATLRETGPQYRILFERNPYPMWVFDARTLRFLAVNDATVRQYGYSRRELLTMTVRDLRPAADRAEAERRAAAETESGSRRTRHRRKSGETFDADVQSAAVRFRRRAAQLVVAIDASRRLQAEREVRRHHAEQERRHLARELHDEIGQLLTGLKLTLQAVGRETDAGRDLPANPARGQVAWAESLVDELIRQIRELSLTLRPPALDDLGLLPALFTHLDQFTAHTAVRVEFSHGGIDCRFSADVETAAFRIVQEALTNVARHAGVSTAKLWVRRDADELCVIVEDAGRGIAPAESAPPTAGLDGMRERAALVGGRLIVDAPETGGTRVTAILPL